MAQERGLAIETFSIEAGYAPHLEKHAALISRALSETMQDFESRSIPVQPLSSNLIGASLLTSTASNLLLDAYVKFRERDFFTPYQEAAALAAAVLVVQPLRGARGTNAHSKAIYEANQQCTKRALAMLLNLEFSTLDDGMLPQPNRAARYSFEPSFLHSLLLSGAKLVDERDIVSTLTNMPSHEVYDRANKIHEGEVRELEFSANKLELLDLKLD
jgi:hypothetical protein